MAGQDGDHCWSRHSPPAAPPFIKYSTSCWEDQRLSSEGKIASKYCNMSKTLERGSIYPPLVPWWGVWFCVYVRGLSCQGSVWFCMRLHFFIKASFIIDTERLVLCHERQYFFFFLVVLFQERCFPSVSFTSNSNFSFKIVWPASVHQPLFEIWNTSSEEFVRRILKASCLSNPF